MKKCTSKYHEGNEMMTLGEMTKDKRMTDGYSSTCKLCARKRKQEWLHRVRNGEEGLQTVEELKKQNSLQTQKYNNKRGYTYTMLLRARACAKQKGYDFDLVEDDIIIPKVCPILGIPIIQERTPPANTRSKNPNIPSLDRIDSSKGYTRDNIQIISWRANDLKRTASLQEMIQLGDWAKKKLSHE